MNKTDFLQALPEPLRTDPQAAALAQVAAFALDQCAKETGDALIYSNIENLPEELLDILAYDFKIDWYDSRYTLEEKRRTIRDSWRVRRFLGTKYAVKTALSAVYPNAVVEEWFEYGGEPYHFRVDIKVLAPEQYDLVKHRRITQRMQWYKNLRSRLDRIKYELSHSPETVNLYMGATQVGKSSRSTLPIIEPEQSLTDNLFLCAGGKETASRSTLPPMEADQRLDAPITINMKPGGISSRAVLPEWR